MTDGWDKVIIGIDPGTNVMGYGILGVRARKQKPCSCAVDQLHALIHAQQYLRFVLVSSQRQDLIGNKNLALLLRADNIQLRNSCLYW